MNMKRTPAVLLGLLLGVLPLLMAQTSGMPSRPRFQRMSIGTQPHPNSPIAIQLDGGTIYGGSPAVGPLLNMSVTRATIQGLFVQNLSTATNAKNFGVEIANDILGHELLLSKVSSTFVGSFMPGIPAGEVGTVTNNGGPLCLAGGNGNNAGLCLDATTATFGANIASLKIGTQPIQPTVVCTTACSAATIIVGQTYIAVKIADTNRASTVTPTADVDLQFTSVPAGRYMVDFVLKSGGGAGGFRWLIPALSQADGFLLHNCGGTFLNIQWTAAVPQVCAGSETVTAFPGQILNGGTSTISIDWAQNASNVANTTLTSNSYLRLTRLN